MSTIHLDQKTDHRLAELATATSKQPEDIVKEALQAYLEDLEDIEATETSYSESNKAMKMRSL